MPNTVPASVFRQIRRVETGAERHERTSYDNEISTVRQRTRRAERFQLRSIARGLGRRRTAPVATTPAPVTMPAAAVHPKGEALLKTFLDEVIQNKTEMTHLTPLLRVNLNQQTGMIPALSTRLQILGPMTAMSFVGVQDGMEIYDVRFTNGSSVWSVVAGADGQLNRIRWMFH